MKWEEGKTYTLGGEDEKHILRDCWRYERRPNIDGRLTYLDKPFIVATVDRWGNVRSIYNHEGDYISSIDVGDNIWFSDGDRACFKEVLLPGHEHDLIDLLKLAMDNYKIRFECKSHAAIGANALRHISSFEELKDFLDKMPERVQAIQEAEKALNELDKIG